LVVTGFPFGETVVLHTRTASAQRDPYNKVLYSVSDTSVPGCAFDPGSSIESVQGRDLLVTQPTVYLPAGTSVRSVDAVTVRGVTYEVDGSPDGYTHPYTGWQTPVVVKLRAAA
jgi:hypothetical protein